jgi:hypothetical protein
MNAGVRISPRFIAIEPVRAFPSVWARVKEKRVTGARLLERLADANTA